MKKELLRIIDANLNRSREGLRVCEEVTRFVLEDAETTKELKQLRHNISNNIKKFPAGFKAILQARDVAADPGKNNKNLTARTNYQDLFSANIQRVKESLRVLEECSGILSMPLSKNFAKIRFKLYQTEKKIIARF